MLCISQKERLVFVGARFPFGKVGGLRQIIAFEYLPDDESRIVFETITPQDGQFLLWSVTTASEIHHVQFSLRMKLLRKGFFIRHTGRFRKRIANEHDVRFGDAPRIAKAVVVRPVDQPSRLWPETTVPLEA